MTTESKPNGTTSTRRAKQAAALSGVVPQGLLSTHQLWGTQDWRLISFLLAGGPPAFFTARFPDELGTVAHLVFWTGLSVSLVQMTAVAPVLGTAKSAVAMTAAVLIRERLITRAMTITAIVTLLIVGSVTALVAQTV